MAARRRRRRWDTADQITVIIIAIGDVAAKVISAIRGH
jgi:hypothetical protein